MTSFVFPGQGSQYTGMCKDFYDNFKIGRRIIEEIEDHTKINLSSIIFKNENNLLDQTNYTQICIFSCSYMIFQTLLTEGKINIDQTKFMFGHSLGEYTALACSNKISLKDCSLILKKRGELMNSSVQPNTTGMAALIGLSADKVEKIIKENKIDLEIANDNSQLQVVISGDIFELENKKNFFLENSVKKFVMLNVSAAFHSKYMKDAENILSIDIEKLHFNENKINIISNYSASPSYESLDIKKLLKKQMSNRVRWTESIKFLESIGENSIIEIGPNKILSGLIKRISNSFDIKTITNISDIEKL